MVAAGKATARQRAPPRRSSANGLSLLEMLVVFVLVALLGTLVFQGLAFFSSRYEAVRDRHRDTRQSMLSQHWFVTSVGGLVPYGVEARRFVGTADAFAGITLAPLNADPGMPVQAQWRIVEDAGSRAVRYAENSAAGDAEEWSVFASSAAELEFQYRDRDKRWHDHWPLQDAREQWIPTGVRLLRGGRALWLANVETHPIPAITEQSLR